MSASPYFRGAETNEAKEKPVLREPDLPEQVGGVAAGGSIELLYSADDFTEEDNLHPLTARGLEWTTSQDVMLKAKTGHTRQRW